MIDAFKTGVKLFFKLFKYTFFIVAFLAIILVVLGNIGGNSPELKKMMEDFASEQLGYPAQIETLHQVRFFPTIMVDLEGVSLKRNTQKDSPKIAGAKRIQLGVGFFSAILGNGQIKHVLVEDAFAEKGVFLNKALKINALKIVDDPEQSGQAPYLSLTGSIGEDAFVASATMAAKGHGRTRAYMLAEEQQIKAQFADYTGSFKVNGATTSSHVRVTDILVRQANTTLASGYMDLKSGFASHTITGDLLLAQTSQMQPDLKFESDGKISGSITMPRVTPQDLALLPAALGGLQQKIALKEKQGSSANKGAIDLSGLNLDLTLDAQHIMLGKKDIGAQVISVQAHGGALNVKSQKGTLAQGQSNWSVSLVPVDTQHRLTIALDADEMQVKDFLADAGDGFDVRLDAQAQLASSMKTWDDMLPNLKGSWTLVSEKGQFKSRWLNVWGDGLASLVLPSLKPSDEAKLNCAIVHGAVEQGTNVFEPLYLDGTHVTLVGTGSYNFVEDKLKVRLKPKTKDISIGDISAAVKISGSLAKPSVSPDALDVGKTAAGVLLGSVNPAFLALATTNLKLPLGEDKTEALCPLVEGLPQGNKAAAYDKTLKESGKAAQ